MTECESDGNGTLLAARQELRIRRGNCTPISVASFSLPAPVGNTTLDIPGVINFRDLCRTFGELRASGNSRMAGVFQRVAVSPDGALVAFEVRDDGLITTLLRGRGVMLIDVPDDEEGLYVVHSDGTGLRHIAPRTTALISWPFTANDGSTSVRHVGGSLDFSPDGRALAFVDEGPGPTAEDARALQIISVDVATGRRRQLTKLPYAEAPAGDAPTAQPRFRSDGQIVFASYADPRGLNPENLRRLFLVDADGGRLRALPIPQAVPGAEILTEFTAVGRRGTVVAVRLPDVPAKNEANRFQTTDAAELFFIDGRRYLQLTNFGRIDTATSLPVTPGRRIIFRGSADPFGLNPTHDCQLFSVGPRGGRLRQLTDGRQFSEGAPSTNNCETGPPPGCAISSLMWQDPTSDRLIFTSSCDPFARGRYGEDVFVMRLDGSELAELTVSRGFKEHDGRVTVEVPGPVAYSAGRP